MITLLIADDESSVRRVVRATLGAGNFTIFEATEGDEAWAIIQEKCPDIALLDVAMPGRTGLDLTRAIKSEPTLSNIRVILISARAQTADIDSGMAAGADLYIVKPFSPAQLLRAVEHYVRLKEKPHN